MAEPLSTDAMLEREAVVRWLRDTARTAARMFPHDRRLRDTLLVNAEGISRGEHRRPPSQRSGVDLDDLAKRFGLDLKVEDLPAIAHVTGCQFVGTSLCECPRPTE